MRNNSKLHRMLLLSASMPAMALLANASGAAAAPATVNVPTGAGTSAAVNASIDAAITTPANPDLTVTIAAGADISGGSVGYDFVAGGYAAGEGDGAVSLTNDGLVTGIAFGGVGSTAAANSFTATNNGEVTGSISATDFGGTASVTNNGSVGGSVFGSAYGDVALVNGPAGEVGGSLIGSALDTANVSVTNNGSVDGDLVGTATTGSVTLANSGSVGGGAFASTTDGAISITNAAAGRISGDVDADSDTGAITIANNGQVLGQTTASSGSTVSTSTGPTVTVSGTTTTTQSSSSSETVGGDVTGTYAGINGSLNFGTGNDGSVSQFSAANSTATVSGSVYGDVSSTAQGISQADASTDVATDSRDGAGTGTVVATSVDMIDVASTGGVSTVNISGTVAPGDSGLNGDVNSFGNAGSAVNVNGGQISGNVNSTSQGFAINVTTNSESTATYDAGVLQGTVSSNNQQFTQSQTGGAASVALQGAANVGGNLNVAGTASALADIGADAAVAGNVSVSTAQVGPFAFTPADVAFATSATRTVDAAGDGTATVTTTSTQTAPAAAGNATLNNGGRIDGDGSVTSAFGNASANITGSVGGSVFASSGTDLSNSESVDNYSVTGGIDTLTTSTQTNSFTSAGGQASVVVDAPSQQGVPSVAGNVFASGVGGASITIGQGSVIGDANNGTGGNLFASSSGFDSSEETVTTYAADGFTPVSVVTTFTGQPVGAAASVTNNGAVLGDVDVEGLTSASLVNNGSLGTPGAGNVFSVSALDGGGSATITDTNPTDAGTRTIAANVTAAPAGGNASFTNNGIAFGDVELEGVTGAVTNNGILTGNTTLGGSVFSGTATVDATVNTTAVTVTAAPAAQTYTVDQNGISRGFTVTGAVSTQGEVASELASLVSGAGVPLNASQVDPAAFNLSVGGEAAVKTADIKAAINLNNGSITLGDIDAQRDDSGAYLTDTTVNLNGGGFLGARELKLAGSTTPANFTPVATLPQDVQGLFNPTAVRVLGVNTVNKTGAGTFVVTGAEYVPAEGSSPAAWTMDVGNLNVQAGELQLDVASDDAVFGIKGNINNDATLVLGRRAPTFIRTVGNSIVTPGPEAIKGIEVYQQGNYTQTANGTTVVGVNPSLVRFGSLNVNDGGSAPEILGPITGGVGIPYFTTPENAGVFSTPSSVTVDGNLNLAGKVAVTVSKDSLYSTGDGYTLFTYTGTGDVTATATPSLSSQFVTFGLKHDTTAKTVAIEATRNSYAVGATNRNAAAAAVGLDSALADVIARVKTDAAGGNGFASVTEIANAQDIANIAAGLDWRLNSAQAAQVFNELSSAEIYGSLAAVDQNAVFNTTVNRLAARRGYGEALGTQLWFNPSANFAKTGGTRSGASKIKTNSYGGAFGIDVAYQEDGAFGVGFGYGQHDVTAQGSPEEAQVRTYTIGAYATQGFGPFYGSFQFAYGFSKFEVERDLTLLARTIEGNFKGSQWDASLEMGYDFAAGNGLVVTPFGKLALRRWSMNGFTEKGGAGIGLNVEDASKTVFSPVIGVKAGALLGDVDGVAYRPYAKVQYSFQGNIGSDRTVQYVGGGNAFNLKGVDPDGHGLIELGIDTSVNKRVNLFLSGGYGFGGHNSLAQVRGGISFGF